MIADLSIQSPALRDQSERHLRELLAEVRCSVPYYDGGSLHLSDYPITSKKFIRDQLPSFISTTMVGNDRPDLLRLLISGDACGKGEIRFSDSVIVEQTSGSSGTPFRIAKHRIDRLKCASGIWRHRRKVDPFLKQSTFFATIHDFSLDRRAMDCGALLEYIHSHAIRWMHTGPVALNQLLGYVESRGATLPESVKFIENSGAPIDDSLLQSLYAASNASIVDQYGCREAWAIGYKATDRVFSPLCENIIVELIDECDRPISRTEEVGRIVITSLHQRLMPFIRYDTGDTGYWTSLSPELKFVLTLRRPEYIIIGSEPKVYGNELFKSIMISVCRQLAYPPFSCLQVRQLGAREFTVLTNVSDYQLSTQIVNEIALRFNQRNIVRGQSVFLIAEVEPTLVDCPLKTPIFTNKYWRDGPIKE